MEAKKKMTLREKGENGIFDGEAARKGYALNKMCYSLNKEDGRKEFLANQDAYCTKFGLNDEQRAAVKSRNRIDFTVAGGSLYFYGKLARMFPEVGQAATYTASLKTEN
jgi:protocatechuate 4,5-dioxygenase alpha subunit